MTAGNFLARQAVVVSRSWAPCLGEVVRLRQERHGQPSPRACGQRLRLFANVISRSS